MHTIIDLSATGAAIYVGYRRVRPPHLSHIPSGGRSQSTLPVPSTIMVIEDVNTGRWHKFLIVVSQDRVAPFWQEMSLRCPDPQRLREALREGMMSYLSEPWTFDGGTKTCRSIVDPWGAAHASYAPIAQSFGADFAKRWVGWVAVRSFYVPQDNMPWNCYYEMFRTWRRDEQTLPAMTVPGADLIREFRSSQNLEGTTHQVESQKRLELSEWDRWVETEIYDALREELGDEIFESPFSEVLSTVEMVRFQDFLNSLAPRLSPNDLELIQYLASQGCKRQLPPVSELLSGLQETFVPETRRGRT